MDRLLRSLPSPPATILDAGGGTGTFAVPLAERGYAVTLVDRSPEWLEVAADRARAAGVALELVAGDVAEIPNLAPGPFAAILCHTVLIYAETPEDLLRALRAVALPDAVLSVLEKNRGGLPGRPAREGDYAEALRVLDDPRAAGRLGIVNRAFWPAELRMLLRRTGWTSGRWTGVRIFGDGLPEDAPDDEADTAVELDRRAAAREPYRRAARLFHVIAHAAPEPLLSLAEIAEASLDRASPATAEAWPREDSLSGAELEQFVDRKRYAMLATTRQDGRPHAAMVAFAPHAGRIYLPAMAGTARVRNLAAEPTASLVVTEGEGREHVAVVIEGDVVLHEDPAELMDAFLWARWRERYGSNLEDWMAVVVELIPTKVLSHRADRTG
jgi:S-adenosylmethionine-dependent methyltransferase